MRSILSCTGREVGSSHEGSARFRDPVANPRLGINDLEVVLGGGNDAQGLRLTAPPAVFGNRQSYYLGKYATRSPLKVPTQKESPTDKAELTPCMATF
jgi:hypothetical protein